MQLVIRWLSYGSKSPPTQEPAFHLAHAAGPAHARRAGRYITQPTGYRAFQPAALPPDPPLELAGDLQRLLSAADRALGRLDGSVLTLPNPDLFVLMYVRKEAVLSSQIEGTQSSLQDLLSAEAQIFDENMPRDVDEVVNYVRAMKRGLARLVPQALGALETFLHRDDDLPPLGKIGLAHVQFETIHPFLDGKDRVGRLLITFLLTERQVLHKPVLYLSHYFKRHRQEYYEHLQAVRDRGEWESWLAFFLRGVVEVAHEATETARRILHLREQHRAAITEHLGRAAGSGHRVLESLFDRPIVTVADVQGITGTTYAAANQLVGRLVQIGILQEMTGYARNRRFRYAPYIALFNDTPAAGRC